ncbi:MAG: methyltransferase domain-containing protein [Flavobacteriales bacterium]|nr:MAG: methyltransferase domain-containing protein [Flavobacteriales bacterium]
MNFSQRSYQKELMDEPNLSPTAFHENLREIVAINKFLGGANVTWKGIKRLDDCSPICLTDVGAGAGDVFDYIDQRLSLQDKKRVRFQALDIQPEAEQYSHKAFPHLKDRIHWIIDDYKEVLANPGATDIVLASLFCHHLNDDELVDFLQRSIRHARKGVVINDLHRHPFAYYSIKLLTRWFSKSEFTKHDAPLSVRRGFTRREWQKHLAAAGISNYHISWQWAFRHLIIITK